MVLPGTAWNNKTPNALYTGNPTTTWFFLGQHDLQLPGLPLRATLYCVPCSEGILREVPGFNITFSVSLCWGPIRPYRVG